MDKSMKAVVFQSPGVIVLEERETPKILTPTDALIEVTMSSICSSDLHIKDGLIARAKENIILGHEMVGRVLETGSAVRDFKPGDRVTVNNETFCGKCFYCKRGYVNNCSMDGGGWQLGCRKDGGQAEYLLVPHADNCLNHIPDSVSDESALLVGDVLATGYWAADIAEIQPGDTVAIIGAGPTGLCAAMCARLYAPANLVLIDISDKRLAFAKEHDMADIIINPSREDLLKIVRELTDKRGADSVLECAGGSDTFEMAWEISRCSGTVCLVAHYHDDPQQLPLRRMYGKNIVFKTGGVHANSCDRTLDLIRTGKIDTLPLITHSFTLDEAMKAYEIFEKQQDGVIKIALLPPEK